MDDIVKVSSFADFILSGVWLHAGISSGLISDQ